MLQRQSAFSLVELMVVIGVITLLAAIAVPSYVRARKRSQATVILENLRLIDAAIDQYAIETNRPGGTVITWNDLRSYFKAGSMIYNSGGNDIFGNAFVGFSVDRIPRLNPTTFGQLSDIATSDFWSPFYP